MAESIFTGAGPVLTDENDGGANQDLGVVWTTDIDGTVTGIRWYFPATLPSGPVTGLLWAMVDDSTGTELARADFVAPVAGTWNVATFDTPVAVTAGSYYCSSIHSPDRYVATLDVFEGATISNGSHLTATANLVPFSNGRFVFDSASPVFPSTGSSRRANYFADVVFVPEGDVVTGVLAATLPALTAAAAGAVRGDGTLTATLPSLTARFRQSEPRNLTLAAGRPAPKWRSGTPARRWAAGQPTT